MSTITPDSKQVPSDPAAAKEKAPKTSIAPQDLLNRLSGVLPTEKEGVQQWYKLLAHPLIIVAGLCLLAYWLYTQKHPAPPAQDPEKARLKKQVKKWKKRNQQDQHKAISDNHHTATGISLMD
ncbi:hypothetical protein [Chitinophaga ginsengisegetis]|uniref:hypothetical protein n=1 Tax=Chitinophaga ginsengisegetis TaxID=393003 RepID=UPI000DB9C63A|nr:hypothetical protein [Chitinophaga ginsengisegetis]MDR6571025.1 hypothetical protein [Chitinophaga ginsengisegetis]MDR6650759.1 hypothetical protein [Chitinophaga ginsengisegetis]MDR6657109.1 hypothetical protein [Chitinophaga ginsengisegetis]